MLPASTLTLNCARSTERNCATSQEYSADKQDISLNIFDFMNQNTAESPNIESLITSLQALKEKFKRNSSTIESSIVLEISGFILCQMTKNLPPKIQEIFSLLNGEVLKNLQTLQSIFIANLSSNNQINDFLMSNLRNSTHRLYYYVRLAQHNYINKFGNFCPKFTFIVLMTIDFLALLGSVDSNLLINGLSNLRQESEKIKKNSFFPSPQSLFTNRSAPYLPEYQRQKLTLVLDLDETLGHKSGTKFLVRPGANEFLNAINTYYELVLFTAASQRYADSAMDLIDPTRLINLRLYKQHTVEINSILVKDLTVLGRDMSKIIIIDNFASSFQLQPDNGIEISS